MAKTTTNETDWAAVTARAQAYQAMHLAGLNEEKVTKIRKAEFLMNLGLSRSEAAGIIDSTDESLRKGFEAAAKKATASKSGTGSTDGG